MYLPGSSQPQVHFQYRKGMVSFQQAVENYSGQYRIILNADTASEVRQMLSQKRR